MARTDQQRVKAVYNTTADLSVHIETAHAIVQANLAGKCGHTEPELRLIETWLAAHYAASATANGKAGAGITSDKIGDASRSWGAQFGQNIMSTQYGQMAAQLDKCGILPELGKRGATWNVY